MISRFDAMKLFHSIAIGMEIDLSNIDEWVDSGRLAVCDSGSPRYALRRNGRTHRWAQDINRIRIPFKVGFNQCGAITEADFTRSIYNGLPVLNFNKFAPLINAPFQTPEIERAFYYQRRRNLRK